MNVFASVRSAVVRPHATPLIALLYLFISSFVHAGVVFNEVAWTADHVVVTATFIDESGAGLHHVRVLGNSGTELQPRIDLADCPQVYTTPEFSVPLAENPVLGEAASCADATAAGDEDPAYSLRVAHEFVRALPVAGEPAPCSVPLAVREDEGTPCSLGRDVVAGIADEISYLCDSLELARYSLAQWERQVRNMAIGVAVALAMAVGIALAASVAPWPWNAVLGVLAAIFLVAAVVFGFLLNSSIDERDRAADELALVESQLEAARERYRQAVEDAIRACCGLVPSGITIDPPSCPAT